MSVSEFEPELFEGIDPADAARASGADVEWLERGRWEPATDRYDARGHFGLLLLDGLLVRRVVLGERTCVELLGPGELLRPWVTVGVESSISIDARWDVEERSRLAMLDARFAAQVGRMPEVGAALMDRLARRSRWLAMHLAICHMPRLETRLRVLLWYVADRWGRVTPEGVVVPLKLTHETLAGLVGARRPAVTTVLGDLARTGEVTRRPDGGYLLTGEPPPELEQAHHGATGAAG